MKTILGKANNFDDPILGIVTKKNRVFRKKYILLDGKNVKKRYWGYKGVITTKGRPTNKPCVEIQELQDINTLKEGDIVTISPNGKIKIVWDVNAIDNCLMITEQCNCNCLMCPQPPKKDSDNILKFNMDILKLIDSKKQKNICITGGEPTLSENNFIEILKVIKNKFDHVHLAVLTNGKKFRDFEFAKGIAKFGLQNLVYCISIHGDTAFLHDEIVRSPGSFEKTIFGIQNLAKFRQKIELRYVINKLNYNRLKSFADFVYRNFPFVVHVAFMGQEISGFAKSNFKKIWIDPKDYQNEVLYAAKYLHQRDINVSIYNIPLCLLPQKAWPFSRQSISEWKNDLLGVCNECDKKSDCCGVFTTSSWQSNNINPLKLKSIDNKP